MYAVAVAQRRPLLFQLYRSNNIAAGRVCIVEADYAQDLLTLYQGTR